MSEKKKEKEEKPARPLNWSGFLKEFLSPVSMGRTPEEQLQRKSWLLMKGFAWRRGGQRLDREESQLFPFWKAKRPGGAAPWCVGHIKIFDRLQHYEKPPWFFFFFLREVFVFPPTADPSHSHQAPWLPRVIVRGLRVQSGPFRSRAVCADTM